MHPVFPALLISRDDVGSVSHRVVSFASSDLDPGELAIKVRYSSVNYKDALAATGAGRIVRRFPCIGGIDLAGEVIESADTRFAVGSEVLVTGYGLGVSHHGGYAACARVPADWAVALPDGLNAFEAMALGTAGFTAALAIERMEGNGLNPERGPVAVTGASGGVGMLAIDMLAGLGYRVVAFSGKPEAHAGLLALGASEVRARLMAEAAPKALEPAEWGGAVDSVGGAVLARLIASTQSGGCVASVGNAGGHEFATTVFPFILRGVSLLGIDSVEQPMEVRQRLWQRLATELKPRSLDRITRCVKLDDLPQVFAALLAGGVRGRYVVSMDDSGRAA